MTRCVAADAIELSCGRETGRGSRHGMSISRFNTALPTPAKGTVGGEEVFVDAHRVRVRYRLVWTALSKMAGRRNVSLAQRGGSSSSGSALTSGFATLHPPPPKKKKLTAYVRD